MKVSLNLLKQFIADASFLNNKQEVIDLIGSQLGAVESSLDLKPFYRQALVVKVISSKPIEGSDHLSVCLIDDKGMNSDVERDQDKLVQVVCGAPNVNNEQIAIWLPPGSVVPATAGSEPLRIGIRMILGNSSNGMLASAAELNIGNDHSGIVVLPKDTNWGVSLLDYLHLDDQIIDIENKMFTHRPDLFGQLGIAREVSAIFKRQFISPEWYREDNTPKSQVSRSGLSVENRLLDEGCPRFMAVSIGNIKIEPSPLWLASYLSRCGIRPVNNIVDVTNYVMLITAQPLHAYDLNKVGSGSEAKLIVRNAAEAEELTLIDGSSLKLSAKDIVVASDKGVLGLAGIMGGRESEVGESTNSIVLECANFDMYKIRHSSMEHGIFSEAVTRFNKGQSPRQCPPVLAYALQLIKQVCPSAEQISEVVDSFNRKSIQSVEIEVDLSLIQSYLGLSSLSSEEVSSLLSSAEIPVRADQNKIYVKSPFWRTDLIDPVDVIEEVGRLYGFDKLPSELPLRPANPSKETGLLKIKQQIRLSLSSCGANELLNYSFTDSKLFENCGLDINDAFTLSNALRPELKYYRISIVPSLLVNVHPNHKAGYESFALFEIGKTHDLNQINEENLPQEAERLGLVVSRLKAGKAPSEPAYYQAREFLNYLLGSLNISTSSLQFLPEPLKNDNDFIKSFATYDKDRSAFIVLDDTTIGIIGEFSYSTRKKLKLSDFCAGFELDIKLLDKLTKTCSREYAALGKFPKVIQDITLNSKGKSFSELSIQINNLLNDLITEDMRYSLTPIDAYSPGDYTRDVNWTFRLSVESLKRTLTDQEITHILDKLQV